MDFRWFFIGFHWFSNFWAGKWKKKINGLGRRVRGRVLWEREPGREHGREPGEPGSSGESIGAWGCLGEPVYACVFV